MVSTDWLIPGILVTAAIISVKAGKLTPPAGFTGFITALCVYAGAGYTGIIMLAAFFLLGTMATSWGRKQKQQLGVAEGNKGRRTTSQVIANAGAAALLGMLVWVLPVHTQLLRLMMAASLASATADTLSSELGNLYGRRFFNILTLRPDTRGLDGVASIEGTLIGIAGSSLVAFIHLLAGGTAIEAIHILVAGTIGNVADSVLGASLERNHYLNNDAVNFLNTAIAAVVVMVMQFLTQ